MKITLIHLLLLALMFISSCSSNEKAIAIENFKMHEQNIELIVQEYLPKKLLTYVEFVENNAIDLSIVDLTKQKNNGLVDYEFDFHGRSLESFEVKRALLYSSTSIEEIIKFKSRLESVNCISVSRPYSPKSDISVEIGYKRTGWSKWYYAKLKDGININDYINKYRDYGYTKLNENWFLTLKSPR